MHDDTTPLDRARIDALHDIDPTLVRDLAALFASETRTHLQALRSSLSNRDFETLSFTAHTVKGAAANLGAPRLASLCHQLDLAARVRATDEVETLVTRVETEYRVVEAALAEETGP